MAVVSGARVSSTFSTSVTLPLFGSSTSRLRTVVRLALPHALA